MWPYLLQVFKTEWPTTLRDQHIQQLQQGFQKLQDRCQVTQLVILPCRLRASLDSSVPIILGHLCPHNTFATPLTLPVSRFRSWTLSTRRPALDTARASETTGHRPHKTTPMLCTPSLLVPSRSSSWTLSAPDSLRQPPLLLPNQKVPAEQSVYIAGLSWA